MKGMCSVNLFKHIFTAALIIICCSPKQEAKSRACLIVFFSSLIKVTNIAKKNILLQLITDFSLPGVL